MREVKEGNVLKEQERLSPFAAKSRQEQKEQWIWWQCRNDAVLPVADAAIPEEAEEKNIEMNQPAEESGKEKGTPVMRPVIHHGQYDAVVRRMKSATQQARHYTSASLDTTIHSSSGSPKNEA